MPQVGNKKFPYTAAGMKNAGDAAKQDEIKKKMVAKVAQIKNAAKNADMNKKVDMKKPTAAKGSINSKATTLPAKPSKTKKKM